MTGFARWRQSPPVEMRGCALGLHSETSPRTSANMKITLFLVCGKEAEMSRWAEWGVYLPEIYLGATWTFTRKPKPSSVKNHKSAVDRKEKIHEQLLELAEDGLVE
jgi:hypothetical protein